MTIALNAMLRNARADQITAFAGAGAILRIYTASYASALVDCVCSATLAPAASGGVLTLNALAAGVATGAGTAAIARLYKSDATTVVIGGLTVATASANINITNTTIAVNDSVTVTTATITEGNA